MIRGTITIPGSSATITNLAFLARALETQVGANILSTPTLLTLDNEEARIIVGQNVPFITGQYATTGGTTTVTPFQTIERSDVGIVLRVQAADHRRRHGAPDDLPGSVAHRGPVTTPTGIILSKRALESSVVVDDKQIVVLGGLIEDRMTDGTDKVPVLGDVPGRGRRCSATTRGGAQKTNLMMFLKPTVLRTSADGREITSERYEYLQGRAAAASTPGNRARSGTIPTQPELPPRGHDARARPARPTPPCSPPPPHPLAPFMPPDAPHARPGPPNAVRWPRFRHAARSATRRTAFPTRSRSTHGVLALGEEGDAVVVLLRPDATVDGLAELKRVLQRPLVTRAVDAERFAAELARAYNVGRRRGRRCSEELAREGDLARLMQDLPPAEDLLDRRRAGAGDPDDQRAAAAGVAGARVRPAFRAVRSALGRALSHRRRAARRDRAAARAACGARLAAQDHGEPRHRRKAPAAGRPASR